MKHKYSIGQILRYKTPSGENISAITSIEFTIDKVIYHFKAEQLFCEESDVLTSYSQNKTRAKRNSKKKAKINLNEVVSNEN